jgi:dihydroorotate dehydrogenase electron transfer subunit
MAASSVSARCTDSRVVGRISCGPDAFLLDVEVDDELPELAPGVFAMLSPADGTGPELGRPFSLYDQRGRVLRFLVQVMGVGTQALAKVEVGGLVTLTFPLGNGFAVESPERPVVMVAGGVGSVPFLLYARHRMQLGAEANTWLLFGARTADRLYDADGLAAAGAPMLYATDDGSRGFHGNVVQLLDQELAAGRLPRDACFCACGPEGLLHGFAAYARKHELDAQLSLETYMGCGFGVCNACPVETQPDGPLGAWPWARTCEAGPIFSLSDIKF